MFPSQFLQKMKFIYIHTYIIWWIPLQRGSYLGMWHQILTVLSTSPVLEWKGIKTMKHNEATIPPLTAPLQGLYSNDSVNTLFGYLEDCLKP